MKQLLLSLLLVLSAQSNASTVYDTAITRILAGTHYGNKVFLKITVKPSGAPTCQTNTTFNYVFDSSTDVGKTTLSLALSAHATGQKVRLSGDGSCSLYHNVETLRYVITGSE